MNSDAIAKATNLDDTLRKWQLGKARELGLKNLDEINKETQLARKLGDSLFKKITRSEGNNAFGLTDAILISGGNPQAISMLLTKKLLGSKRVQSAVARKLAPKPTIGAPRALFNESTQGRSTQGLLQSGLEPQLQSVSLPQTIQQLKNKRKPLDLRTPLNKK